MCRFNHKRFQQGCVVISRYSHARNTYVDHTLYPHAIVYTYTHGIPHRYGHLTISDPPKPIHWWCLFQKSLSITRSSIVLNDILDVTILNIDISITIAVASLPTTEKPPSGKHGYTCSLLGSIVYYYFILCAPKIPMRPIKKEDGSQNFPPIYQWKP